MISRQKQKQLKPQTEEALCSPSNSTVWKHVTMCLSSPALAYECVWYCGSFCGCGLKKVVL